jgi:hypothetical protein
LTTEAPSIKFQPRYNHLQLSIATLDFYFQSKHFQLHPSNIKKSFVVYVSILIMFFFPTFFEDNLVFLLLRLKTDFVCDTNFFSTLQISSAIVYDVFYLGIV